jgi:two-component system NtrC family sensor kinase
MKWKWSSFDLQAKMVILACVGLTIWLFTFAMAFWEIQNLNKATQHLELAEDLNDSILEMRRYEKNFLLYQGQENLEQTVSYFDTARNIYLKMKASPEILENIPNELKQLDTNFQVYSHVGEYFNTTNPNSDTARVNFEKIRANGNQMIDSAKQILRTCRSRVARTARKATQLPLVSIGFVVALYIFGMVVINRRVVRPLVLLEKATGKIGRGDFSPISHSHLGKVENEVHRLVFSFNRMVEELDARQEQIVHSRKIASLGTLVSGVAHELNNPINNIILTVDTLVGKRKITDERRAKMMNDILEQAIRASGIVKNLLDFSRAETASIEDVDMLKLLGEIFKLIDNDLTMKKIRLHRQFEENLPVVQGNHQGLQQVFFNLIINAIQAMDKGGELTVTATLDENRWIVIAVKDTGVGISEEDIPHIFDPFFTTKEVGKGTGLGLSVIHGIIKRHGGRITVESRKDEGSTFTVAIPAKEGNTDD